jgi:hypothetical protein
MLILNFMYPLRCLRVPPVEYHCTRKHYAVGMINSLITNWKMWKRETGNTAVRRNIDKDCRTE